MAEAPADPFDGILLRYSDPVGGGATLPTMNCEIQMLRPGEKGRAHRHTHTVVYHAFRGSGTTKIGDQEFNWEQGDSFVLPLWNWHCPRKQFEGTGDLVFDQRQTGASKHWDSFAKKQNHDLIPSPTKWERDRVVQSTISESTIRPHLDPLPKGEEVGFRIALKKLGMEFDIMAFTDLRTFIDGAARIGELKQIDGADWNLEIGCLTELMAEQEGPLLLFDNITGYPKGFRIAANVLATRASLRSGFGTAHGCAEAGNSSHLAQQDSRSETLRARRSFSGTAPGKYSRRRQSRFRNFPDAQVARA